MDGRYWVIGGKYADARFNDMIEGTSRLAGPFDRMPHPRNL